MALFSGFGGVTGPATVSVATSRYVADLDIVLRELEASLRSRRESTSVASDLRRAQLFSRPLQTFTVGMVTQALPSLGWYRVRTTTADRDVPCCSIHAGAFSPVGARIHAPYAPGQAVLIAHEPHTTHGYILGAIPVPRWDTRHANQDWIVQGGGGGPYRSAALQLPFQTEDYGSVRVFTGNAPVDSTLLERGWVAATGVGVIVDDFHAQVRVNESCGLFVTYVDSYCRLAGHALDIESAVSEFSACDDEGEARIFCGYAAYPWEALGLYTPGLDYTISQASEKTQTTSMDADVDVQRELRDLVPFYRTFMYAGYLGQGSCRYVVAPPVAASGYRRSSETLPDEGVFREFVGLDGYYLLQTASGLYIGKRVMIPVPKQRARPEVGSGDSAVDYPESGITSNYKASSLFGSGLDHKIRQLRGSSGDIRWQRILGMPDVAAYLCNWASVHPFHYHGNDFFLPQPEQASAVCSAVTDFLNFGELANGGPMSNPTQRQLRIDHRYGDISLAQREAFFTIFDDGSVMIACGYGSALILSGGDIRLEAPGDVRILAGRSTVNLSSQIILRAEGSVDVSSATKDVRIKADNNLQLLAGNSGRGGLLLESKSRGDRQDYKDRVGEEVDGRGIVLKAADGLVAVCGRDVYLRSSAGQTTGHLMLDAGDRFGTIITQAASATSFLRRQWDICLDASGAYRNLQAVYRFSRRACVLSASSVTVNGFLRVLPESGAMAAVFHGGIAASGSVTSGGILSDRRGGLLGRVREEFLTRLQENRDQAATFLTNLKTSMGEIYETSVKPRYRDEGKIGHEETLQMVAFSYRDDDSQQQYRTGQFVFPETRWQMFSRFGLGSGGRPWQEKPVLYQGRELYPWPGRKKWVEERTALQYRQLTMFDPSTGRDRARPGPYETAMLGGLERKRPAEIWQVI